MATLIPATVSWVSREQPLTPIAAVAIGPVAIAIASRLAMPDERTARLHGAVSAGGEPWLVLRGAADDLPWTDGIIYLGIDAAADGLLLPTTRRPEIPADVFARAIGETFARAARPLAVLETPRRVIAMGELRPLDPAALRLWLERAS